MAANVPIVFNEALNVCNVSCEYAQGVDLCGWGFVCVVGFVLDGLGLGLGRSRTRSGRSGSSLDYRIALLEIAVSDIHIVQLWMSC